MTTTLSEKLWPEPVVSTLDAPTDSAVALRVKRVVADYLVLKGPQCLGNGDDLAALGIDSLNLVGVLVDLETEFEVAVPDEAADVLRTVADLIAAVAAAQVTARQGAAL